MSLRELHTAWAARFPKGTRIRATFELTRGAERESFELILAGSCLVNIGTDGDRKGYMRDGLLAALDGIVTGFEGAKPYDGWTFDPASLKIEQAPSSAKRSEVKALLAPLLAGVF